jgi:hypothetical protein
MIHAKYFYRFCSKFTKNQDTECWEWTAAKTKGGYGCFWVQGKQELAHRFIYEQWNDTKIPQNLQVDHLCSNRGCVNPAHLEPVTCKENLMRAKTLARINSDKTHCDHGHKYTPENTYLRPTGGRDCMECRRRRQLEYKQRQQQNLR